MTDWPHRRGLAVVTPEEMAAIDAAAPEPVSELISRAGAALATAALRMLGGVYGRRVVVVAGPGNNGNDGREAARCLQRRGVRVDVIDAKAPPEVLPPCDLVIDAAFGTGFRGSWVAPTVASGTSPMVLACDIVSGLDGLTGEVSDASEVLAADVTVTFAAAKPGLLLGSGPALSGVVEVADIGLDVSGASMTWLTAEAVAGLWPVRERHTHKWRHAVWVVAGSPGMEGAAALVCGGAQRAGAGYVRLTVPQVPGDAGEVGSGGHGVVQVHDVGIPVEVVRVPVGVDDVADMVEAEAHRFGALVVGNGLGLGPGLVDSVERVVHQCRVPVVVDADGLRLLGLMDGASFDPLPPGRDGVRTPGRGPRVVLTPHDGEFAALDGGLPEPDRVAAARRLAERSGAVVLLKGPTTVVAHPDGRVLLNTTADARLATAGTGDVLAGVVAALCARGLDPFEAAGVGSFCHARAADLGWPEGLVASDLLDLLPLAIAGIARSAPPDNGGSRHRG